MATNKTPCIRTIHRPIAGIPALSATEILQLIRSETTAGAEADVGELAIGDIILITPNDLPKADIEKAHFTIVPGQGQVAGRAFIVADVAGLSTAPAQRHLLLEIPVVAGFW